MIPERKEAQRWALWLLQLTALTEFLDCGIGRRNKNNIWGNDGWKVLNFMKTINAQIQETQWTPSTRNTLGGEHLDTSPKYIIMKLLKTNGKMKNLKSAREKGQILHTENRDKFDRRYLIRNNASKQAKDFFRHRLKELIGSSPYYRICKSPRGRWTTTAENMDPHKEWWALEIQTSYII